MLEVGYAAALLSGIKGACRIVLDKAGDYAQRIPKEEEKAPAGKEDPDEVPFAFFYAIRRCEMGLVRRENIMAERQLSDARKCLLDIQLANEGKNPRFMEYNSLSGDFLTKLEKTYPRDLSLKAVREAEQAMTALYEEIYEKSGRPAWSPEMKYLYDYETNFQFQ